MGDGDTKLVYVVEGKIVYTNMTHLPTDDVDWKRINAAGGFVRNERIDGKVLNNSWAHCGFLHSDLRISRSIGDYRGKDQLPRQN